MCSGGKRMSDQPIQSAIKLANVMANVETATQEQLHRAARLLIDMCNLYPESFPENAVRKVLTEEAPDLGSDMFKALRARVEAHCDVIARRVTVNRDQKPFDMLDNAHILVTGSIQVLQTIPSQGSGTEEVIVYFFRERRDLTPKEQDHAFVRRGFVPDYYAQIQANIDDPDFCTDHKNGAQWDNHSSPGDGDEKISTIVFHNPSDFRQAVVACNRNDRWKINAKIWNEYIWLAGRIPREEH